MNEKRYILLIAILLAVIFIGGAGSGWLLTRANRNGQKLADDARSLETELVTLRGSITQITGRYIGSEVERERLDNRNRELADEIRHIIERFGYLDGGLSDAESGIATAAGGVHSATDGISEVIASIGEALGAAEANQDDSSSLGSDSSN